MARRGARGARERVGAERWESRRARVDLEPVRVAERLRMGSEEAREQCTGAGLEDDATYG
jgi:hypothetical protein